MQLKRKGKERKGKGLLYLIGISVLISIVFIACNKKPTASNDFAEIDKDLPWVDGGSGNNSSQSKTLKNTTDADSPVIVISGNNLILAYGKNNKVYYRSSHDLGETLTTEMEFGTGHQLTSTPTTKKYPHIFFDGSKVIAVATTDGSKLSALSKPLVYITGTFKMDTSGVGYIGFNKWGTIGIMDKNGQSGTAGNGLASDRYFNKEGATIQTAAGVGRIVGGKYLLPISETTGTKYLKLEAKQYGSEEFGAVWDLSGDNKGTKTANNIIVKLDESGNILGEDIAEKSEGYSIKADGTLSGSGLSGSPKVGNGTSEASIAVSGGYIYTFTKETSGLVFRKFSTTVSGNIQ